MEFLNKTTSLSPITKKVIPAKIIKENNKIYMEKYDEDNNRHLALIENDVELYKALTRHKVNKGKARVIHLHVTSRCNLNCNYCYAPSKTDEEDMSLTELSEIMKNIKNKPVVIGGGEPTCHPKLPGLIKTVSKKNFPLLLTNGINLTDISYLKTLKKAGLCRIVFSLNGFSDDVFKKTNGEALLKTKLKALDNIRKLNIATEISLTLAKEVNEGELKPIFQYCMENTSWIKVLKIRTTAPIGRYASENTFLLSEIINLFSKELSVPYASIMKASSLMHLLGEHFNLSTLKARRCSLGFYLSKKNIKSPIGNNFTIKSNKNSFFIKIRLLFFLLKNFGFVFSFSSSNLLSYVFGKKIFLALKNKLAFKKGLLKIEFRRWPNINDIDLEENKKCTSYCVTGASIGIPFCYRNIIGET